jgi:hypothetical protein
MPKKIPAWRPRIVRIVEAGEIWEIELPAGSEVRRSHLSVEGEGEGHVVWVPDGDRKVPVLTSVLWEEAKAGRHGLRLLGRMTTG